MINARKFVLYSTTAGIFATAAYSSIAGVNIQLFYLLMILNLFLMMVLKRLWFPLGLFILMIILASSGILGILRGTDSFALSAKEFAGVTMCAFYFCCFFRTMDFKLVECFNLYARMAYWVAILGIVIYPVGLALTYHYRLASVFTEPSAFVFTCIPALYFFADQWQRHRTYGREFLVMLVAFVLAESSNGFIGILLGIAIFLMRYRRARLAMPFILIIVGTAIYTFSADVQVRSDDSLQALQGGDLTGTNMSTWALFSNFFVAERVFEVHPFFGNGLGSHPLSYKKYIGDVTGYEFFAGSGEGLNATDANSLALRVLSDMGLVGFAMVLWFLWKYRPTGDSELDTMSKGIWLYFFLRLLRGGQYFLNEQYFFTLFYVLSHMKTHKLLLVEAHRERENRGSVLGNFPLIRGGPVLQQIDHS